MKLYSDRAGKLYHVQSDYDCYVPNSLNDIKINYDDEMINLLSEANRLIGKLDGIAINLPDKDIFISKYVEKEAVVSSQIEGTQASLSDVLQLNKRNKQKRKDTKDIVNYIKALNYGTKLLNELPISIRFLKAVHKELLSGVRGEARNPREIRNSQNWIGPKNSSLNNASFIPPSVDKMKDCLNDLELYMNNEIIIDPLTKIGLIHYQFETIHPFLDGNGRLGRLLIPLWMIENKTLKFPILYLSLFFKQNRNEYYSLLMDVRLKGHYEEWIKFFLKGIIEMSNSAINTIIEIDELMDDINNKIETIQNKNKENYYNAMKFIYKHPYFDSRDLKGELKLSKPTISKIIKELLNLKIIKKVDGNERYITYQLDKYVEILEEGTEI